MIGQQERMRKEERKRGSYMCLKGGLFLKAFPMKPLKPNLQKPNNIYAYKDNMAEC
jgi:hypothetical protein